MVRLERDFQANLIKDIEAGLPDCIIMKNDASYRQGVPDLIVLYGPRWATLEVKRSEKERYNDLQPNQEYYVELMSDWSFSAFIYPENKADVLSFLFDFFAYEKTSTRRNR